MKEKNEKEKEGNKSTERTIDKTLEGNRLNNEGTKIKKENDKKVLNIPKDNILDNSLYNHNKVKKDPIINITKKELQTEYLTEVNYILVKMLCLLLFSIISFAQSLLILHNYKNYSEVLLKEIFSAFLFFNSIFLLFELYREGLRDQMRYVIFRLFAVFLSLIFICYSLSEIMNTYVIYNKIKLRKEKCRKNKALCGDTIVNNIILILSIVDFIGIIYLFNFPLWLGFRSIKILLKKELEVLQKQLLENEKKNLTKNKNEKNKSEDKLKGHAKSE